MTVGEALAEARCRAGLTVDEVSERTRIRQAVIRSIEQDDYDACGGDLYVRGYVRAIAGAVGLDARPLIREFDAGGSNASKGAPGASGAPDPTIADPEFRLPDPDPDLTIADPGFTLGESYPDPWDYAPADPDPGYMVAEPVYRLTDPAFGLTDAASAADDPAPTIVDSFSIPPEMAASAPAPAYGWPAEQPVRRGRARSRLRMTGIGLLLVMAAAGVGVAGSHIVAALRHAPAQDRAATVPQQRARAGSGQGAGGAEAVPGASKGPSASSPTAVPSTAAPPVSAPPVLTLPIASATAFGPDGMADGDNPQVSMNAITPGSATPWQTDWYTTATFGQLKSGTGLLLDMGRIVTITSVRIDLSPYDGTNLQLQAGAAPGDLPVVASASDVGGTVRLRLTAPVRARYLLVWFTLLPPDGSGTFQESVYRVVVHGRP